MFNVVVHRRKRRAWSARTVAVSVGAHLLVVGGIAAVATSTGAAAPPTPPDSIRWIDPQVKPHPQPPAPVKPATPTPPQPRPAPGATPALHTPERVPTRIDPPKPGATPPSPDPGEGPAGPAPGPPAPGPQPPSGGTGPLPDPPDSIFKPEAVEQLPRLLDPRGAQRLLERVYPGMLRDAGVTGHTTVVLVIDENGRVVSGSVTVRETTHDAFREAAVRAAERFRFRPARLNGQPVPVRISLPIEWTIQP